jgi:prophage tail gpP-like protein
MARVVIPDKQIDEAMFVYERVFTMSRGQGKRTRLKLIPAGSLVLGDVPGGG